MSRLSISLLGHFGVTLDDKPIADFATDKARALLAYLAVESDRPHRRDTLAGLLWPDQPEKKARHSLRQALSHLRQAIADPRDETQQPFLLVTRQSIQFNTASDHSLDVATFQSLAEACRTHRHRRLGACLPCLRRMQQMADLYRQNFLNQFFLDDSAAFEEWAALQREWFRREMIEALIALADYHERRGEREEARRYAQRQVTMEPWREEAHRQLMRLLARDGQRSAALAQYETCRQMLTAELNVKPMAKTQALYATIREGRCVEERETVLLPHTTTPFVGRERELDEIAEMLSHPDARLVTIFGPGGIGKTRLALRSSESHVGAFRDGVVFVPLLAVSQSHHLIPAIADALRISPVESQSLDQRLSNYLGEREMLLVLDNFEHLVDGGPQLSDILCQAPGVVLLITSREKLNLREEWVYEVEGLTCSSAEEIATEACDAIDLFEQCAHRVDRTFTLSEQNRAAVAHICHLVEGMPLGIELAVAWVTVHTCQEIAREIESSLEILTSRMRDVPQRHRNIRATFEHSWRLLSQEERDLLRRLSIFRGGFGAEAAAQVAQVTPEGLLPLLDKALIRRVGPDRYDMHETLRQYIYEKLRQVRTAYEHVRLTSARYFAAFLRARGARLQDRITTEGTCLQVKSSTEKAWQQTLHQIGQELENSRQALFVAVSRGDEAMVERCLEGLYQFYAARCRFQEGRDLFAQAVNAWPPETGRGQTFARLLARQGVFELRSGRYQQAKTALEDSLAMCQQWGWEADQVFSLIHLVDVLRKQGLYAPAEQLAHQCLTLSRKTGDTWGEARSLYWLGLIDFRRGKIARAQALYEQSLALDRQDDNLTLSLLNGLGDINCHQGNYAEAQSVFEQCVELSRDLENRRTLAIALNNLGTVLHVLEKYEEARPHYRESLEICREIGDLDGQAIALSNLGEIAFTLGCYRDARAFYRDALSIGRRIQDQRTIVVCLNNLGEIACALDDYPQAKAYYTEALRIATAIQASPLLLGILVNLAAFFANQERPDRAAMLLDVVQNHPAGERAIQEKAQELKDKMNFSPPVHVSQSLDNVVTEILAELEPIHSVVVYKPRQSATHKCLGGHNALHIRETNEVKDV